MTLIVDFKTDSPKYQGDIASFIHDFKVTHNSMGDMAYLLNQENKLIALSQTFQNKFEISQPSQLLGHSFAEQNFTRLKMYKDHATTLEKQNDLVRSSATKQVFLDVINYENVADTLVVHKTPIYCIASQTILIHARMKTVVFARLDNLVAKIFDTGILPENIKKIESPMLTARQRMVIYCYLRNYSYNEISIWMTAFGAPISPPRVIEHLNRIKTIIGAKNKEELRTISIKLGYNLITPTELMPEGSYTINDDIYDLWLC